MAVIEFEQVSKSFKVERKIMQAVREVDLKIQQGEFVFFVGSSGAGKSTMLRLLTNELKADSGRVLWDGVDMAQIPRWRKPYYCRKIGQVWQEPRLIRRSTVGENIAIALRACGRKKQYIEDAVPKALGIVGLKSVMHRYPYELSGGEVKRVELARAIANNPHILVVDELTANLDNGTAWDIVCLLQEINRLGVTVIMATHAREFVNILHKRVVTLVDGRIRGDVSKGKYGDIV